MAESLLKCTVVHNKFPLQTGRLGTLHAQPLRESGLRAALGSASPALLTYYWESYKTHALRPRLRRMRSLA